MTSTISDDPQAGVCPLPDWELWGCATTVERVYGAYAHEHIAERIGTLAKAGDWNGVATWKAIAARLDLLYAGGPKQ
jgi:hypothetical protein